MKKLLCSFLATLMLLFLIVPVLSFAETGTKSAPAPSEVIGTGTEINVNWTSGYIGSNTHSSYKNKQSAASGSYNVSDVITVPKAGTKIYFTDKNTGDTGSNYVSATAYVFSVWKQQGSAYVIDLSAPNIQGSYDTDWIAQRKIGKTAADGMLYEFVTDCDNENIRISYRTATGEEKPKVYMVENCGEASTKALYDGMNFTAVQKAGSDENSGTFENLRWFIGYVGSATNTNGSANELRLSSDTYRVSGMFRVAKAGTEVSFTVSGAPNNAFYAFSIFKESAGVYTLDFGFDATDNATRTGSNPYTFKYVTNSDNEILRVGYRTDAWTGGGYEVNNAATVSWKYTGGAGTGSVPLKTEWPDAELVSPDTGIPLIGTVADVKWNHGYIGSQYNDSAAFSMTSPSNVVYYYTDVFTVPKAGTDVIFFDQTFTDFDGGNYASTSVLTISHWNKNRFDKTRVYLTGNETYSKIVGEYYRVYRYTTTEDNEQISVCLRLAPKFSGEDALIQPIYLVEKQEFDIGSGKFADKSGKTVEFTAYLPEGYASSDDTYPLIFDTSADGAVAAAAKGEKVVAISAPGATDEVLRLFDTVLRNAKVRISDVTLVGGDEIAAHLKKYESLRFCAKFIYTGNKTPASVSGTTTVALSTLATAKDAVNWSLGKAVQYYDVLQGITMYAIGDSYFGGSDVGQHQTWVNILGCKYNMNFRNFGIGGNTMAFYSPLSANQPPMSSRISEIPSDGDIYLVEGGRNDRHYAVPFGENDSTDKNTFKGAINIIINYIKKNNPDAFIVLVTPWSYENESSNGLLGTNNDYANAMKAVAEYRNDPSVVCLYAADKSFSKIDAGNASIREKYFLAGNEVSHLNVDGMYRVEPIFEEWIANAYASYKNISTETTSGGSETTASPEISTDVTTEAPAASKGCGSSAFPAFLCLIPITCVCIKKKKHS